MLLLHNRGIQSGVQITSFSLSVCRVRRVVEIVDSYTCDHCYVCLIISLINFIPFGLLRNRFIKNAIRSNVLINRFEILPSRSNNSENRLNAFDSRFNALTSPFDFFLKRSNDLGNHLNAFDSQLLSVYCFF